MWEQIPGVERQVIRMDVVWMILVIAAFAYGLNRVSSAPAARGVSVSDRLAEARRIAEHRDAPPSAGRRPREHPLHSARGDARRNQPRSRVAYCDGRSALRLRHTRRA
jgi:hypothetical protein